MATPPHAPPPERQEEAELLARLRRGDREAFSALVDRLGGPLLRFAGTFLRSTALAEEVVQDTWLAALDGLGRFEGRSSVRAWLFGILANRARTRATREARSLPFSALARDEAGGPDPEPPGAFDADGAWRQPPAAWGADDPERLALRAETRLLVEGAIAALPPAQRAVLTLRDVDGLEAEEICDLLGITLTNQRVLLHRARTRLRESLARHLGKGGARGT